MKKIQSEDDLIKFIKRKSCSPKSPYGIGDDAALLKAAPNCVITTDFLVEGVDFKKGEDPKGIGRKVLGMNLSDLAAMGAEPGQALLYAAFPKKNSISSWRRFLKGWNELAKKYKVSLIGGDLSQADRWMIGAVCIGTVKKGKLFTRSKARNGDLLFVTGKLGGSILRKHLNFEPRVRESLFLRENFPVSSCIDLSDGLGLDLPRLLQSSRKGARIQLDQIPISQDAKRLSDKAGKSLIERAFQDGEDFELLFTLSPQYEKKLMQRWRKRFNTPLTMIGDITAKRKIECFIKNQKRSFPQTLWKGFDHFQ
jgi:thiamine-monophosphate kinase